MLVGKRHERSMKVLLALAATLLLATCAAPPPLLQRILEDGELRVVTRNSPDAFYLGSQGPEGPAYDLASRFAEYLGVPLRLYTVRTREAAIEEVAAGRAHIAAAGLSTGVVLPDGVQFGPGYQLVREHLIYRRRTDKPSSMAEAARGQIEVATGSVHQRTLEDLRLKSPELAWIERADSDTEEILADVSKGRVQYTLASSTEFALNRSVHPELAIALDLSPQRALAWVVNTGGFDSSLLDRVNAFFVLARREGLIASLLERYYGEDKRFDYLLSRNFVEHLGSRLPQYAHWFQEAAQAHGLDWHLLAAMGYQESKWDAGAVSFSGATGLMQLTEDTASRVRAGDRSDPRTSIFSAAKYLSILLHTLPRRIPEPDRTWFAVAAYNVGIGHLEDARILAQAAGKNPDKWEDVRDFLPLLAQERWYPQTKRGYARGWEPVRYVENVQAYLNMLQVADTHASNRGTPPEPELEHKSRPRKR